MRAILPESRAGAFALLCLFVLACYSNALTGAFQFDDYKTIVDYPGVHSLGAWWDKLGHGIRPLLKLSYTLNWISGYGVTGFHFVNLLIHVCNVWLVYLLADEFMHAQVLRERMPYVPLFTALVFAAHPAHTEAVSYICGRSVSLMATFYLAGVLTYARGRARDDGFCLHVLTPLLFVLALATKEIAVTFPLALLAWERASGGSWNTSLRRQWTNWSMLLFGALFFLLNASYVEEMERSAGLNSLQGNVATQASAFAYLLKQWLLPFDLNVDPDLAVLHALGDAAPQLSLLAGLCWLTWYVWRRRPWLGFALAWFLIHLLPLYVLLPRLDVANDRQLYLADWPLALACMAELAMWTSRRKFAAAGMALVLLLGAATMLRNRDYRNEISLWQDTVLHSPGKARVHNNLGYAYMLAGRNDEARREFVAALKIEPGHVKAFNNLLHLDALNPSLP